MSDHLVPSVQTNPDQGARQQLPYQTLCSSFRTLGAFFTNHLAGPA
jgi:hypothetical protein